MKVLFLHFIKLYFFLFCLLISSPVLAGDATFNESIDSFLETYQGLKNIVFIVAGFGILGLSFAAVMGKIKWGWVGALALGLLVVSLAGEIVDYLLQEEASSEDVYTITDYAAELEDIMKAQAIPNKPNPAPSR